MVTTTLPQRSEGTRPSVTNFAANTRERACLKVHHDAVSLYGDRVGDRPLDPMPVLALLRQQTKFIIQRLNFNDLPTASPEDTPTPCD